MDKKVLVLDDEKPITDMLVNYLELEGYDVIGMNDPIEALQYIRNHNVHVVISDIMMPGMTGVEFLKQVKAHDGMIQVIMITGYVTMDNVLDAFRNAANNIYFKPLESLDLIRAEVEMAFKRLERMCEVLKGLGKIKTVSTETKGVVEHCIKSETL